MKLYNLIGIGAFLGIVHGSIAWFVKTQIILIYSQSVAFQVYYNPYMLAFAAANLCSALSLAVIYTVPDWYGLFEEMAYRLFSEQNTMEDESE